MNNNIFFEVMLGAGFLLIPIITIKSILDNKKEGYRLGTNNIAAIIT